MSAITNIVKIFSMLLSVMMNDYGDDVGSREKGIDWMTMSD